MGSVNSIVIVGGGASGILLAAHLLRRSGDRLQWTRITAAGAQDTAFMGRVNAALTAALGPKFAIVDFSSDAKSQLIVSALGPKTKDDYLSDAAAAVLRFDTKGNVVNSLELHKQLAAVASHFAHGRGCGYAALAKGFQRLGDRLGGAGAQPDRAEA